MIAGLAKSCPGRANWRVGDMALRRGTKVDLLGGLFRQIWSVGHGVEVPLYLTVTAARSKRRSGRPQPPAQRTNQHHEAADLFKGAAARPAGGKL